MTPQQGLITDCDVTVMTMTSFGRKNKLTLTLRVETGPIDRELQLTPNTQETMETMETMERFFSLGCHGFLVST